MGTWEGDSDDIWESSIGGEEGVRPWECSLGRQCGWWSPQNDESGEGRSVSQVREASMSKGQARGKGSSQKDWVGDSDG